jgi:cysteine-rich repeat protein
MGKIKHKIKKRTAQNNFKLLGVSLILMGIAIAYSAFYIITSNSTTISSEGSPKISRSIFQQGATTLLNHCAGVCNQIATKSGDIVIKYNGDIMVSGAGSWDGNDFPKEKSKNVSIPAGEYTVKLESYDNFVGREDNLAAEQSQEQYYVVFKDGSRELTRTATTGDLDDGVEEATGITYTNNESNTIILSSDADKITVVHAGPSSQLLKHGFEPVCMLLERVEVPTCPDGHVDAGEQCDDGNTVNGDGCSSTCRVEHVCGDESIDAGEQCDDGNTVNGDGCSSTCRIEQL